MKKNIILVIKGFFMGIANIIPGVSGGTLAITMGIYERLIEAQRKENEMKLHIEKSVIRWMFDDRIW